MCCDLRVHVLCALNGCMIEQRILYTLFGTDLPRIASYTAAASAISYFRRHTVLKIPNSYFQMLADMHRSKHRLLHCLEYIIHVGLIINGQ